MILRYAGGKTNSAVKDAIKGMRVMPKVQLGKSGGFVNVKNDCPHSTLFIAMSGMYKYAICRTCGKNVGEVDIPDAVPSKGKKSS